jgi:hypothetical protein
MINIGLLVANLIIIIIIVNYIFLSKIINPKKIFGLIITPKLDIDVCVQMIQISIHEYEFFLLLRKKINTRCKIIRVLY